MVCDCFSNGLHRCWSLEGLFSCCFPFFSLFSSSLEQQKLRRILLWIHRRPILFHCTLSIFPKQCMMGHFWEKQAKQNTLQSQFRTSSKKTKTRNKTLLSVGQFATKLSAQMFTFKSTNINKVQKEENHQNNQVTSLKCLTAVIKSWQWHVDLFFRQHHILKNTEVFWKPSSALCGPPVGRNNVAQATEMVGSSEIRPE